MARLPVPGAEWAGFRIEEEIGEGGLGRVYAAWDPVLERRVALKVLVPGRSDELDGAIRERFLLESRAAAGLDHPRIVPIHTASEYEGTPYLVMRFVDGGNLRDELARAPLSLARTVTVVRQVAGALDRAHRSGLVHGDVKPANVLCVADGEDVYLTDFGSTRRVPWSREADSARAGAPPASPHYAAPEQLVDGGEPGSAADVYSLGCTAFACLTGRVPFPGSNHLDVGHQHLHAARPTVTGHRPDLPRALDGVLARAMAVEAEDRYASCGELADALGAARDDTTKSQERRPVPAPAPTDPGSGIDDRPVPAPRPGRSVFDQNDTGIPWSGTTTVSDAAVGSATADPPPPALAGSDRRVIEVEWDDPDDYRPRSRLPWIVGGALLVATVAVGALVVRAVNTDARLDTAATTTSAPVATTSGEQPTLDELRGLVPASLTTCVPTAEPPGDDRVRLACPRDSVPELVTYTLFTDGEARQAAFVDAVASLELDPGAPGECALADDVVHAYVGTDGRGQVACRFRGSRVDLVWTRGDVPLLATAGGNGFFGAHYRFWEELVERSDAPFPVPIEADLLADLPAALLDGCRRDIDLTAEASGIAAVTCEPDGAEPDAVSWVRFADGDAMDAWIDERRASLGESRVDTTDDACSSGAFGDGSGGGGDEPAASVAGFTDYAEDGTSGSVLCFVDATGQNVVSWTRDDSRIGSIAVSDAASSDMGDLLEWWEERRHLP